MIILDCEQDDSPGSDWMNARLGIPTASNFDRIATATSKASAQADEYLYELVAEWITGEKKSIPQSFWMERGIELEPDARTAYEFITDEEVTEVGFVFRDEDRMIGCSPDGLIGEKGFEVKCPAPITHVSYVLQNALPKKYIAQVQGSMWVAGLDQWVFMSYHPDYEPLIVLVEKDEAFHKALDSLLPAFVETLTKARANPKAVAMRESRLNRAA